VESVEASSRIGRYDGLSDLWESVNGVRLRG
jgi:hypothetical protein